MHIVKRERIKTAPLVIFNQQQNFDMYLLKKSLSDALNTFYLWL